MRFSEPQWLLAGLFTCLAMIGMWRQYDIRQRSTLAKFVAPHLLRSLTGSVSGLRRMLQRGLLLASILCLFGALAGPLLGYHWEQISRRGNEVLFAIDTSRSMLAPDVKPNRLTRAKLAIDDMAAQLDGDGIGIVAFAGSAFLVCPLTLDTNAFRQSLEAVDVKTIPLGGTNISSAIEVAQAALRRRSGSDKILILVTDGENLEGDALAAAREASKQDGLKIYTVGIGTTAGELIPLPASEGGGFVKDQSGAMVKSRLDEAGLQAIAAATGGAYVHLDSEGDDFSSFLATVFAAVSKHDLAYRQQKIYDPRYQWPLAASLVLLLTSLLVGTRRSHRRRTAAVSFAIAMLVLVELASPRRSEGANSAGAPAGSLDASPLTQYNAGTSAYRAGQFPQATQAFEKSIKAAPASDAKRLADQQDAYYNLGNALYRAGQQLEKSAPQEAIQKWTEAVKAYDTALQLRRDDVDSKYNRDLVQKKIDALRQPPDQGGGGQGQGGGKGQGKGSGQSQGAPGEQGKPPPPQSQQSPPPPQQSKNGPPPSQRGGPASNAPPPPDNPSSSAPGQAAPQPPSAASAQGGDMNGNQEDKPPSDNERAPGQMSVAEARELLDSAKSDEHNSLAVPSGPRDPEQRPEVPKNW